jgi:caa(3)-type oxidase subunit IV
MATPAKDVIEEPGHEGLISHPSDLTYIKVAIVLAVLTAAEVSTYFLDLSHGQLILMLVPLMVVKFGTVAAFFMHLKFDAPLFTRMFGAGIAFAIGVYIIMLTAFRFWE